MIAFIAVAFFTFSFFSLINFTGDDIEGFSCKVVQKSCDGWTDCDMKTFRGEQIACINGEQVYRVAEPKQTIIKMSTNSDGDSSE